MKKLFCCLFLFCVTSPLFAEDLGELLSNLSEERLEEVKEAFQVAVDEMMERESLCPLRSEVFSLERMLLCLHDPIDFSELEADEIAALKALPIGAFKGVRDLLPEDLNSDQINVLREKLADFW